MHHHHLIIYHHHSSLLRYLTTFVNPSVKVSCYALLPWVTNFARIVGICFVQSLQFRLSLSRTLQVIFFKDFKSVSIYIVHMLLFHEYLYYCLVLNIYTVLSEVQHRSLSCFWMFTGLELHLDLYGQQ
jgi:hypothetical protein